MPDQAREFQLQFSDAGTATHVLELTGHKAQRLADLALHAKDLVIAAAAMAAINSNQDQLVKHALWRSAIVHYVKCFAGGHEARFSKLSIKDITADQKGRTSHAFFDALRNKHIVHDENSFSQCQILGLVDQSQTSWTVVDVLYVVATTDSMTEKNLFNLANLIGAASSWVANESENVRLSVLQEYRAADQSELELLKEAKLSAPCDGEADNVRPSVRPTRTKI